MSRYLHSKSALFLMELLFNLLLFCVLCGCGLLFFLKSHNLSKDTTLLHHAVSITTSVASIYESGDGSFSSLCNAYESAESESNLLYIYLDEEFNPCSKTDSIYYVLCENLNSTPDKIRIDFYNSKGTVAYSIRACNHTPSTLNNVREVSLP